MYLVREAVSPTTSSYDHLRDQSVILTASSSQLDDDDDVARLREADKQIDQTNT
jgi:hypothetical protein